MPSSRSAKDRLEELNELALQGGGKDRQQRQRERGKLTARERIEALVDVGSFVEIDRLRTHRCHDFGMEEQRFLGDGVVTGSGKINGRQVFIYSQDFTVFGGSLSSVHAEKICKVMDLASSTGAPVIGLCDSGGARIQEGVESLAGYAEIFYRNTINSGVVPQISCIMGPCAGGAVYSPALTDFIFMVEDTSYMFITGPDVIRAVTHEEVTKDDLGGGKAHNAKSGVAHFLAPSDVACLDQVRHLLSFLPLNNGEDPPATRFEQAQQPPKVDIAALIPDNPNKPYDMREVISGVVDGGELFQVHELFAQNIIVGFARLRGKVVGVVANQPQSLAGCLNIDASVKGARFVRFCDCFNVPLLTFVDVPGFLPGLGEEHGGIIRHGAKLLYAFAEATVPKVTVITRKAYGGAYDVMASKHIRADLNLAFPSAEIAVMGPQGAVNIVCRREIEQSDDPEKTRADKIAEYRDKFANPYKAAELGYIDEVILPDELRERLVFAFEMLSGKRQSMPPKKHGNIPL